jgi:hypothetical protein
MVTAKWASPSAEPHPWDFPLPAASLQYQLPLLPPRLRVRPSLRPRRPHLNSEQGHRGGAPRPARRQASCPGGVDLRTVAGPAVGHGRRELGHLAAELGCSRRRAAPDPARPGHAASCSSRRIAEEAAIRRPCAKAEQRGCRAPPQRAATPRSRARTPNRPVLIAGWRTPNPPATVIPAAVFSARGGAACAETEQDGAGPRVLFLTSPRAAWDGVGLVRVRPGGRLPPSHLLLHGSMAARAALRPSARGR